MKNKKFNLFDLLIVIVILGIAAAFIFRNQIRDTVFSTELKSVAVTVRADAVSNAALEDLTEGSKMYRVSETESFGEIKSVSSDPVAETVIVGSEEMEAQSAYYSSVSIVLLVEGYVSDGSYYAKDGTPLLVRGKITLENDSSRLEYTVTAVELYENRAAPAGD